MSRQFSSEDASAASENRIVATNSTPQIKSWRILRKFRSFTCNSHGRIIAPPLKHPVDWPPKTSILFSQLSPRVAAGLCARCGGNQSDNGPRVSSLRRRCSPQPKILLFESPKQRQKKAKWLERFQTRSGGCKLHLIDEHASVNLLLVGFNTPRRQSSEIENLKRAVLSPFCIAARAMMV